MAFNNNTPEKIEKDTLEPTDMIQSRIGTCDVNIPATARIGTDGYPIIGYGGVVGANDWYSPKYRAYDNTGLEFDIRDLYPSYTLSNRKSRLSQQMRMTRSFRRRSARINIARRMGLTDNQCLVVYLPRVAGGELRELRIWTAITRVTRHLFAGVKSHASKVADELKNAIKLRITTELKDATTGALNYISKEISAKDCNLINFDPNKDGIEQNNVKLEIPDHVVRDTISRMNPEAGRMLYNARANGEVIDMTMVADLSGWWTDFKRGFTVFFKKSGEAILNTIKEVGLQYVTKDASGRAYICQVRLTDRDIANGANKIIAPFPCLNGQILDNIPAQTPEELAQRMGLDLEIRHYNSIEELAAAEGKSVRGIWAVLITAIPWVVGFVKNYTRAGDDKRMAKYPMLLNEGEIDYGDGLPYPIDPEDYIDTNMDYTSSGEKRGSLELPVGYVNDDVATTIKPKYEVEKDNYPTELLVELSPDYLNAGGNETTAIRYLRGSDFDWDRYSFSLVDGTGLASPADISKLSISGFDNKSTGRHAAVISAHFENGRELTTSVPYEFDDSTKPTLLIADALVHKIAPGSEIDPAWISAIISDGSMDEPGELAPVDFTLLDISYDQNAVVEGAELEVQVSLSDNPSLQSTVIFKVGSGAGEGHFTIDKGSTTYSKNTSVKIKSATAVWGDGTHYYTTSKYVIPTPEITAYAKYHFTVTLTDYPELGEEKFDIECSPVISGIYTNFNSPVWCKNDKTIFTQGNNMTMRINWYNNEDITDMNGVDYFGLNPDAYYKLQHITFHPNDYRLHDISQYCHTMILPKGVRLKSASFVNVKYDTFWDTADVDPYMLDCDIIGKTTDDVDVNLHPDMLTLENVDNNVRFYIQGYDGANYYKVYVDHKDANFKVVSPSKIELYPIDIEFGNMIHYLEGKVTLADKSQHEICIRPLDIFHYDPHIPGTQRCVVNSESTSLNLTVNVKAPVIKHITASANVDTVSTDYSPDSHDVDIICTLDNGRTVKYNPPDLVMDAKITEGCDSTQLALHLTESNIGTSTLLKIDKEPDGPTKQLVISPLTPLVRVGEKIDLHKVISRAYYQLLDGSQIEVPINELEIIDDYNTSEPGTIELRIGHYVE